MGKMLVPAIWGHTSSALGGLRQQSQRRWRCMLLPVVHSSSIQLASHETVTNSRGALTVGVLQNLSGGLLDGGHNVLFKMRRVQDSSLRLSRLWQTC